jgi:hypothetical protein
MNTGRALRRLASGLPNIQASFENGRVETIRATGAVLIGSILLYFSPTFPG